MFFTILFPLMFLVLFGGIFKDQTALKVHVVQIGSVALLDQIPASARGELDEVMEVDKSSDRAAALEEVRKGDADAAVEQNGSTVVLHYSLADQVKARHCAGCSTAWSRAETWPPPGSPAGPSRSRPSRSRTRRCRPSSTSRPACWPGPSPRVPCSAPR